MSTNAPHYKNRRFGLNNKPNHVIFGFPPNTPPFATHSWMIDVKKHFKDSPPFHLMQVTWAKNKENKVVSPTVDFHVAGDSKIDNNRIWAFAKIRHNKRKVWALVVGASFRSSLRPSSTIASTQVIRHFRKVPKCYIKLFSQKEKIKKMLQL